MFRIEYLKLKGHPQLGDLNINLSDINESDNIEKPYTSVIIGPNGTGKSYILRTIAEIFRDLYNCKKSENDSLNISIEFDLQYYFNQNQYRIIQKKIPNKRAKILEIMKNTFSFHHLNRDGKFADELLKSSI